MASFAHEKALDVVDAGTGTAVKDADSPLLGGFLMEAYDALVADGCRFLIDKHRHPLATAGFVLDNKFLDALAQGDILLQHDAVEGNIFLGFDFDVSSVDTVFWSPISLPIAVAHH